MVEGSFWYLSNHKNGLVSSDIRKHSVVEMKYDVFLVTTLYFRKNHAQKYTYNIQLNTQQTNNPKMVKRNLNMNISSENIQMTRTRMSHHLLLRNTRSKLQ